LASRSRLQIAKADIAATLDQQRSHVLKYSDFGAILRQHRVDWRLAVKTSVSDFIAFLMKSSELKRYEFDFPHRPETLYVWKNVPTMEMLLHLKRDSFYSHYTAMRMHGLTEQVPATIYISHERVGYDTDDRERPEPIEQSAIDAAFQQPARITKNSAVFGDRRIVLIHGAYTGKTGVESMPITFGTDGVAEVRVTDLERTLIEAVAKPWYSGGVAEVAKAFEQAKSRAAVNRLGALLKNLGYLYPYHQAVGYYMERAGYRSTQLDLLRRFPMEKDFYLDHQIPNPIYVKDWRLWVPSGF
jgi:predicted transcriptional regulator of viral defense system